MKKIILDLCGGTGAWSRPYKKAGYNVLVITLPFYDITRTEIDEEKIRFWCPRETPACPYLEINKKDVYGILAAPPCDQFSRAKTTGEPRKLKQAMKIVESCMRIIWGVQYDLEKPFSKKTRLKFWAMENPNGMLKFFMGKPCFIFNPFEFGNPYKKETYLWGNFNEPEKKPVEPNFGEWNIHAKTGGKSAKTKELRSITPEGFANAFYKANK
jgi:hypothetical protein